ncbi:MAG TPA: FtsH protease activity modulator HflK [Burkholderiales bacterium]|nr:FtsH protease activity modulator HflK [Burkholderiales bacterium]
MSLNDPQWGKRGGGNEGPPDLDEMWRNFNRKLNGLFSRRRGAGGSDSGEPPSMRQLGGGAGLIFMVVLVAWLASGFYIVVEGQRGVVLTFGKFSEVTASGLRWRFPYPIQSHEIVNLAGVRTIEVGYRNNVKTKVLKESLMLTDDENIVDIQMAVQYTIRDAKDFLFNNRQPEDAVLQAAETALREVVGKSKMDQVLNQGQAVVAKTLPIMQEILDRYKTGILISNVNIQNVQPPEQVQAAFYDAVKANQDRERLKNEGQSYFNDVVPRAAGVASRLLLEAEGYKQRVIANSEGDASRFRQILVEYNNAPQVTRERMYLDTVQQVLASTSKILIDAKAGSNLLYLPLDKIVQMSGAALPESSGSSRSSQAPEASAQPESGARSRDTLRGRERGDRP